MADRPPQLEPSIIVIFGITGDLAQRFLLPALYHLIKEGLLHQQTEIVGISRSAMTAQQLLDNTELCINETDGICDPDALKAMHQQTHMLQMDVANPVDYTKLLQFLNDIEDRHGVCMNRLYYLAIPPQVYRPIIAQLGAAGLNASCQHGRAMTRILVEKPFGYDLQSAEELIAETATVFGEDQVFRIDHYLAKETVQNILTFRFQNPIFKPLWNREHIAAIEISASEQIGIEGRAAFYEPLGALRDFIQSHLLQLLAVVTMDEPAQLDSDSIHAKRLEVLQQVNSITMDIVGQQTHRSQYQTYRDEAANDQSRTETFAAIQTTINSDRWRDVPITIWTGKGLAEKRTEICIHFNDDSNAPANELRFRIQPNEGIELDLQAKKPGFEHELQTASMDFSYKHSFGDHEHPSAYERVLVDAFRGDHTLFATGDEVLRAWQIVEDIIKAWAQNGDDLKFYPSGTKGEDLLTA